MNVLLLLLLALPSGEDWPNWRGPARDGISPEVGWSSAGAAEPLWRAEVGLGYSSPSVSNGRLFTRGFLAGPDGDGEGVDVTVCLDAVTGEERWTHETPSRLWDNMHGGGTLTTPTVAGDTVYVLSRLGPIHALDVATGEVRWERRLDQELEVDAGFFGIASSPLVLDGVVYLNVGKSLALDARSGELLWQTRDYGSSYAVPEPFVLDDRPLLAVFNGSGLTVLDRKDGSQVALYDWISNYNVNAASPIVVGNEILISTGYNEKGCALLALEGGELTPVWSSRRMSNLMTGCVLVDGLLVGFDKEILRCLDFATGDELWAERGLGKGALIASDGRLIVLSEEGELLVAPLSSEGFEPEARTRVFETGPCWTTPVLANGRLYLRNGTGELVCRDHRQAP